MATMGGCIFYGHIMEQLEKWLAAIHDDNGNWKWHNMVVMLMKHRKVDDGELQWFFVTKIIVIVVYH